MLLPVTSLQEDEEPARKESPGPVAAPQSPTFSEELGFETNTPKHSGTSAFGREVPRTCEMVSVQNGWVFLGHFQTTIQTPK